MSTLAEKLGRLQVDKEAAVAEFRAKTIAHPRLKAALAEIVDHLVNPGATKLLLVVGPSGVGKSRLLLEVFRELTDNDPMQRFLAANPASIPALLIQAKPAEAVSFSFNDFFVRALQMMHEPVATAGFPSREPGAGRFQRAFERAALARDINAVLLDEAEDIVANVTPGRMQRNLKVLVSLSHQCGLVFVLAGTDTLASQTDSVSWFARRAHPVVLDRYQKTNRDDVAAFVSGVKALPKVLPIPLDFDPAEHWEALYDGCGGCFGVLMDWTEKALRHALGRGDGRLARETFTEKALIPETVSVIVSDARQGEQRRSQRRTAAVQALPRLLQGDQPEEEESANAAPRKPFARSPVRDPVGEQRAS